MRVGGGHIIGDRRSGRRLRSARASRRRASSAPKRRSRCRGSARPGRGASSRWPSGRCRRRSSACVSHCPMCRPVAAANSVSCASGSRTNSIAEAEDAVEEDEGADELARLVARLGPPEHEAEDRERGRALRAALRRVGSGGARGRATRSPSTTSGKRTPHGTLVGAPHNSAFTKLASRPNNSPNGTVQAT